MGVIYPNRNRSHHHRPRSRRAKLIRFGLIGMGAFVLCNLLIAAIYYNRTFPRTTVAGAHMGNVAFGDIEKRAGTQTLPAAITLRYEGKKAIVAPADLGLSIDSGRTKASLNNSRNWLPLANLFIRHELAAPIAVNDLSLQQKAETLVPTFHQPPTDAGLKLANSKFEVVPGRDGYDLSIARLKSSLLTGLDAGTKSITVPVSKKAPKYGTPQAGADARKLQSQLDTPLSYQAGSKTIKLNASDIATWFVPADGGGYRLDDFTIKTSIARTSANSGLRAGNLAAALSATKQALETRKALSFKLEPYADTRTYRYCIGLKGVDESHLQTFENQLKQTYADLRGWGLEGQVAFVPADSECDFTVWLTRADLMPTFGAICDPEWSCRVGSNVVINFTRWQETSPAWRASGGSLENYRHMVINHETGHWFGFDHSSCPGSGQAAPVMQQQSIDLQGCTFNPWPTERERSVLRRSIGL